MLRAGASMKDITPKAGGHLSGAGFLAYRPAETVLDPLYAKAVAIASDQRRVCLIGLDVTLCTEEYADRIRRVVSERHGLPFESVLVHTIQTHSAPGMGAFMLDPDFPLPPDAEYRYAWGGEPDYSGFATEQAIEAAAEAFDRLRPVQVGVGRGVADKLAFNRRLVTRKGDVVMAGNWDAIANPAGPTDLLHYEGPTDPEVGVVCFRDDDMKMVAQLLNFACHPVNVFSPKRSWNAVSADWCGAWSRAVQDRHGADCVPLVLNGCCGNLNPWDPFEPNLVPDHLRMGRALARVSEGVVDRMRFTGTDDLQVRDRTVPLDLREVPPDRARRVDEILSRHPRPVPEEGADGISREDWFLAASTRSIACYRKRNPRLPYEIHAIRIGDVALVGLPGEPFVEGQLAIKVSSPAPFVFVAHCTSQYVGYLPIRDAYARGGHEANALCPYWAKVAPGSLEEVVARSREMVAELFAGT